MANQQIEQLEPIQEPQNIKAAEGGSKYVKYKKCAAYEYALIGGKPDKSRVKIRYDFGDIFDGVLKRGKYVGRGKYAWESGDEYSGNFKRGRLEGKGTFTAANGDVFEGTFKKNKYNGSGKYTWASGVSFEGTFKRGRMISGRLVDELGNVYSCSFSYHKNGERKSDLIRLVKSAETDKQAKDTTKRKKENSNKSGLLPKDERLLTSIRKSKSGAIFKSLYSGGAVKGEQAEKNMMTILNFFTDSDAEQMKRIFISSSLYDKQKGDAHVSDIISSAINGEKNYVTLLKGKSKANQRSASRANQGAERLN